MYYVQNSHHFLLICRGEEILSRKGFVSECNEMFILKEDNPKSIVISITLKSEELKKTRHLKGALE